MSGLIIPAQAAPPPRISQGITTDVDTLVNFSSIKKGTKSDFKLLQSFSSDKELARSTPHAILTTACEVGVGNPLCRRAGPVTCPRAPCGRGSAGTQPHQAPRPMRIHRPRQLEAGEDVAARGEAASRCLRRPSGWCKAGRGDGCDFCVRQFHLPCPQPQIAPLASRPLP